MMLASIIIICAHPSRQQQTIAGTLITPNSNYLNSFVDVHAKLGMVMVTQTFQCIIWMT